MLKKERQQKILALLQRNGKLVAGDLSRSLRTSDDTIRRDLRDLDDAGLLQRVHGGALPRTTAVAEYTARVGVAVDTKDAMALATVKLLREGQVILLDGGTSVLSVAQHLPADLRLTVVTHSIPAMAALAQHARVEVIMLGGRLFKSSQVAVGADTIAALRDIRADVCILGVSSVHPDVGISVLDYEEAQVKRAMVEASSEVIVLATEDKLNKVAPYIAAPMERTTHLVTERGVSEDILAPYQALGINVIPA